MLWCGRAWVPNNGANDHRYLGPRQRGSHLNSCSFRSPEPKSHWWAYSVGRHPPSVVHRLPYVVRLSTISNISSEAAGPIEANFHVEPPWEGRTKACPNGLGHIASWPPCPCMVKTVTNLHLWNQKADDLDTWCAAFGTRVLQKYGKIMNLGWPYIFKLLFLNNDKAN